MEENTDKEELVKRIKSNALIKKGMAALAVFALIFGYLETASSSISQIYKSIQVIIKSIGASNSATEDEFTDSAAKILKRLSPNKGEVIGIVTPVNLDEPEKRIVALYIGVLSESRTDISIRLIPTQNHYLDTNPDTSIWQMIRNTAAQPNIVAAVIIRSRSQSIDDIFTGVHLDISVIQDTKEFSLKPIRYMTRK